MSIKVNESAHAGYKFPEEAEPDFQKRYTLAEYKLVAELNAGYELDEGKLVRMSPTKKLHGKIIVFLITKLNNLVLENKAGEVLAGEVGFNLFPEAQFDKKSVRAPDIAFLSNARLAKGDITDTEWIPGPPDLAIEVLSPTDEPGDINRKILQYQQAKTPLIWLIDPKKKIVLVYRAEQETPQELRVNDILDGGDILPGFSVEVKEIFG